MTRPWIVLLALMAGGLPAQAGLSGAVGHLPRAARLLLPIKSSQVVLGHWGAAPVRRLLGQGLLRARVFSVDPSVLQVQEDLVFLRGHDLAFVRFKGLKEGPCALRIQGPVDPLTIEVRVVPGRAGLQVSLRSLFAGMALAAGDGLVAEAWGPNAIRDLTLALDGKVFRRMASKESIVVPFPRGIRQGRHVISVVARDRSGFEARQEITVRAQPEDSRPLHVEAERCERKPSRPGARYVAAGIRKGRGASGGFYCSLHDERQQVSLSIDIQHTGSYQFRVRAGGDLFGDYPVLAVFKDGEDGQPLRYGAIATTSFSMFPLGPPLFLKAGRQQFNLRFVNDLFRGKDADRNLYLDFVELQWVADHALDDDPPSLSVLAPADGQRVTGTLAVRARASDSGGIRSLSVYLGKRRLRSVPQDRLVTRIEVGSIGPGAHVLRIVAEDRAGNLTTRTRRIECLPYVGARPETITVSAVWARCPKGQQAVPDASSPTGWRHSQYTEGKPAYFTVKVPRSGRYRLHLVARGDWFEGWPEARVVVDRRRTFNVAVRSSSYKHHRIGWMDLKAGEHEFKVSYINDRHDDALKRDRNLHVACLRLREQSVDQEPPQVRILRFPRVVWGPDLVIVQASDNETVEEVRLQVDGVLMGFADRVPPHGLWLRGDRLKPGTHRLKAQARDTAGNIGTSDLVTFSVRRVQAQDPLSVMERAQLLINRLGLGGGRRELEQLLLEGESAWLDRQLAPAPSSVPGVDDVEHSILRAGRNIGRRAVRNLFMEHLYRTRDPVRARLAAFFENHFNTWIGKTQGRRELLEWRGFRRHAMTSFRELLGNSAHGGAMLEYLDNQSNRVGRPNENYAREIMELHTLGVHGGYTQADVVDLARIFTGWGAEVSALRSRFSFTQRYHDLGPKRALGVAWQQRQGVEEGEAVLDLLSAHPSCALFICQKLAAHLVADDPPVSMVRAMARSFLETGGDIPSVIRTMLEQPLYFQRQRIGAEVCDALELLVGLRRSGIRFKPADGMGFLARSDRMPFECVPPTGYPERTSDWLDSQAELARWNFAADAATAPAPAVLVIPRSASAQDLRAAIEECALNVCGRVPPRGETAAVLAALRASRKKPTGAALLEAVLRMPSTQRH